MTKKKVKLSVTSLLISALLIFSCVGAYAAQNSNQYDYSYTFEGNNANYISKNLATDEEKYYNVNNNNAYSLSNVTEGSSSGYIPDDCSFGNISDDGYGIEPTNIIGSDGRSRVTNTTSFPYSAICYLETKWKDGTTTIGTAWMYWKDIAITAGHCVYSSDRGGWAKSVTIWPGRNGSTTPYGSAYAKVMHTSTAWTNSSNANYDYGLLELNKNIGTSTGYFGMHWTSSSLNGKSINVAGYPGSSIKIRQLWKMNGKVASCNANKVYYSIDTEGGQSGSPVYWYNSTYGYQGIAIHAYGGSSNNSGTRITQSLFDFFTSFRD